MRVFVILFVHLIATVARLAGPGGIRSVVAESVLVKHQVLIGTIRREYMERTPFWTTADLDTKLLDFRDYFNRHRAHAALGGRPPERDFEAHG